MKCPVCKSECGNNSLCIECGFDEVGRYFLSREEGEKWLSDVVLNFRNEYWLREKSEFVIDGKTIVSFHPDLWSKKGKGPVVVPYGIDEIGQGAFRDCEEIESVYISESVVRLADGCFERCKNLQEVYLPQMLSEIGNRAFAGCQIKHLRIPKNVKRIGTEAFVASNTLKLTLEHGIEEIGEGSFAFSPMLTEVRIPGSVRTIGKVAFGACLQLKRIALENGIETIKDNAFGFCSAEEIRIPRTVRYIGANVFSHAFNLKRIIFNSSKDECSCDSQWLNGCNATVFWDCKSKKLECEQLTFDDLQF